MRLLNVYRFEFEDFNMDNIPPYAIASHRWSTDEVTYKDVLKRRKMESEGWKKIEGFCAFIREQNKQWRQNGYGHRVRGSQINHIWIDTCCINKDSSAELSESINSMFDWYSRAYECYAYLNDVRPMSEGLEAVIKDLEQSVWFTRGWTLQELIVPSRVVFLTREWEVIGCKANAQGRRDLTPYISRVTSIPYHVLNCYGDSWRYSTEEKMTWSASRSTTRPEDVAYSMLGIFDVHMPLIYGEGRERAFRRLRREIAENETQTSIEQEDDIDRTMQAEFEWLGDRENDLRAERRRLEAISTANDQRRQSSEVGWRENRVMRQPRLSVSETLPEQNSADQLMTRKRRKPLPEQNSAISFLMGPTRKKKVKYAGYPG